MRSSKKYVILSFFILFTALKLVFPHNARVLRKNMDALTAKKFSYTDTIETLGRAVTDRELRAQIVQCFYSETGAEKPDASMAEVEAQFQTEETPVPTKAPTASQEPLPEAVQAFLKTQEKFEGSAIPVNVRVDMPVLPFEYTSPVSGVNSSGFGYRLHPLKNEIRFHYGTDFAADKGECVRAFADGYVYAAGISDSYGYYYILTHKSGFSTLYAHLSEFVALEGEAVKMGETIGKVGDTGDTTGPHLHFELSLNNMYINPEYYI